VSPNPCDPSLPLRRGGYPHSIRAHTKHLRRGVPQVCQLISGRTGTRTCFSTESSDQALLRWHQAECCILIISEALTPRAEVSRNLATSQLEGKAGLGVVEVHSYPTGKNAQRERSLGRPWKHGAALPWARVHIALVWTQKCRRMST
jgi:hypothetical protein